MEESQSTTRSWKGRLGHLAWLAGLALVAFAVAGQAEAVSHGTDVQPLYYFTFAAGELIWAACHLVRGNRGLAVATLAVAGLFLTLALNV